MPQNQDNDGLVLLGRLERQRVGIGAVRLPVNSTSGNWTQARSITRQILNPKYLVLLIASGGGEVFNGHESPGIVLHQH